MSTYIVSVTDARFAVATSCQLVENGLLRPFGWPTSWQLVATIPVRNRSTYLIQNWHNGFESAEQ